MISLQTAIIGTLGLSFAMRRTVPPLEVNARIALDFEISATYEHKQEEEKNP